MVPPADRREPCGVSAARQAVPGVGAAAPPASPAVHRVRRRRRPSGELPPLPRHLAASGKWWLGLSAAVVASWVVVAVTRTGPLVDVLDARLLDALAELRSPGLTQTALVLGVLATGRALQVLWLVNLAVLVVTRRWRHLFLFVVTGWLVITVGELISRTMQRPRPFGIEVLGDWSGFSMPSLPMTVLATFLVGTCYALVPAGRARTVAKATAAVLLVVTAGSRLYLAQDHPSDVLCGVILGVTVPLAAFRLLAPNDVFPVRYGGGRTAHLDVTGSRGEAVVRALRDQLGLVVTAVTPFGLAGSGGSTPLRITIRGDPDSAVFGKLYALTHVRSDRWFKLGRTLLYGRLEDEKPYHSVRRLVQHEDYVLRLLHDAGLPVPKPMGIVELTPEREYLLVMEFMEGARELGDAEVDDAVIDQGLAVVRRLWEIGMAHRDIKPANILVRDGRLYLIDSAFAEVRPSPWRQAVDLANMMLVLALRTDAERVYRRARRLFTEDEIAEAFAATHGLTMPSQLRRMLRAQGRDLHDDFLRLLPHRLPPVRIQRWTVRRVGLLLVTLLVLVLAVAVIVPLLGAPL